MWVCVGMCAHACVRVCVSVCEHAHARVNKYRLESINRKAASEHHWLCFSNRFTWNGLADLAAQDSLILVLKKKKKSNSPRLERLRRATLEMTDIQKTWDCKQSEEVNLQQKDKTSCC